MRFRPHSATSAVLAVILTVAVCDAGARQAKPSQIVSTYRPPPPEVVAARRADLDRMLAAYVAGDREIVARTLHRPLESAMLAALRDFLQDEHAGWQPARAAFALEFSAAHLVFPSIDLRSSLRVIHRGDRVGAKPADDRFEVLWHQITVGLLETGAWDSLASYLDAIAPRIAQFTQANPPVANRFALAQAISTAIRCCRDRLDPQAKVFVVVNRPRPGVSVPTSGDALIRFDAAAANPLTREDALVWGAFVALRTGHPDGALARLDRASSVADKVLAYAAALIRAGAFDAQGEPGRAAEAYQAALILAPEAQVPAIGLAAAFQRAGRIEEATASADRARRLPMYGDDPWPRFLHADARFVDQWMRELRALLR